VPKGLKVPRSLTGTGEVYAYWQRVQGIVNSSVQRPTRTHTPASLFLSTYKMARLRKVTPLLVSSHRPCYLLP
jgi:hypothetical protein